MNPARTLKLMSIKLLNIISIQANYQNGSKVLTLQISSSVQPKMDGPVDKKQYRIENFRLNRLISKT